MKINKRIMAVMTICFMLASSFFPGSHVLANGTEEMTGENEAASYRITSTVSEDEKSAEIVLAIETKDNITVQSVLLPDGVEQEYLNEDIHYTVTKNGKLDFKLNYTDNKSGQEEGGIEPEKTKEAAISYEVTGVQEEAETSTETAEATEEEKQNTATVAEQKNSKEAVDGVMVLDISQGLVVITDEGFVQGPAGEQHFNPSYDEISGLDSFTSWTGPYRITGSFERTEDRFNTSDPVVEVLGGSPDNPIQIELQDANLNNKKDSNKMYDGSAFMIGGSIYRTTTSSFETIPCAVDLKLTGSNTAIGSKLCSGVEVYDGSWLRIHGEGSLEATGGEGSAGIGGSKRNGVPSNPTIIIDSGTIHAIGGEYAAGIGGGMDTAGGTISINGGNITAQGGLYGAGIGGGLVFYPGDKNLAPLDIHINGGTVQATGGGMGAGIGGGYAEQGYTVASEMSIQIGGTADVTAVGGQSGTWNGATGIGAGYTFQSSTNAVNPNVVVKKIEINGGKVSATGAACAAGIGASSGNHVESIVISDGEVTALGGNRSAGIGTGYSWKGHPKKSTVGDIQISGGNIQADGGEYAAGIGSGQTGEFDAADETIKEILITGGDITANGQANGAGIGCSAHATIGNIKISGGNIKSRGGEFAAGVGSGAEGKTGDITITAGNITSGGGKNGAGIGTGHTGIVGDILISSGNILATTDFSVGEDGNVDGNAAGIGGGVDGTVQSIKLQGDAEITAISGVGGAGIGRGYQSNITVPVIPITIEDAPNIIAYATGTLDDTNPAKEASAIDLEGVTSCSTNILQGHFKNALDYEKDKNFIVRGDTGEEYSLTMPQNFQSFAVTTSGIETHRVYVDDALYSGSKEMNEDKLTPRLQVNEQSVNPYWYLQPAEQFTVTFDSQGGTPVNAVQVAAGEKIVKPEDPTREGYIFQGWYKEANTENAWDFSTDTVNSDLTLYAGWSEIGSVNYTVEHYKQNKDGTWPEKASETELKSAKPGAKVKGTAKDYSGYVFDSTVEGTVISGVVKEDGSLVLKLYYKKQINANADSNDSQGDKSLKSVKTGDTSNMMLLIGLVICSVTALTAVTIVKKKKKEM